MNKRHNCSYCDKTYASRQGKSRHQKICSNKSTNLEENLEMETESFDTNNSIFSEYEIENEKNVHVSNQERNMVNIVEKNNEEQAIECTNNEDIENLNQKLNYFGMEDTNFLTPEELLNVLKTPYKMVSLILSKIYFEKNVTVSATNLNDTTVRIFRNNKWSFMKKEECFDDMIDKTYQVVDMFYTYEGIYSLSEEEKTNYENFQKYYDDDNMNLKKKLCEDIEKILKNKTNNSIEIPQLC